MTGMQAAVRDRYGSPDVVELREVERPTPVDDEVLVRVRAASVNRADLDGITPRPSFVRLFIGLRAPRNHRLGLDVAGVVERVGPRVTRFRPGDEVFGDLFSFGQGAFAEYVSAPERAFASMPAGMTFEEAATLPHSAILAVQGLRLRDSRSIRPGDKVLIDGASGNVGPFAVQIAKSMGADVTARLQRREDGLRAFARRRPRARLHRRWTTRRPASATTGSSTRTRTTRSSASAARFDRTACTSPSAGWPGRSSRRWLLGPVISAATDRWMGLLLWWKPFAPDDVATLKELIAAGKLAPVIDRRFPLGEIGEALRYVDDGRASGKVIIVMGEAAA